MILFLAPNGENTMTLWVAHSLDDPTPQPVIDELDVIQAAPNDVLAELVWRWITAGASAHGSWVPISRVKGIQR